MTAINARLAQQQKQLGLDLVSLNNTDFLRLARDKAVAVARSHQWRLVSADDLRPWAAANHIEPAHPNAWGAVFKDDRFEFAGYMQSQQVSRRGGVIRVWRLKEGIHA